MVSCQSVYESNREGILLIPLWRSLEGNFHTVPDQCKGQTVRVIDLARGGVGIGAGEALIEQHQAVRAAEHQIAGVDLSGPLGVGRQTFLPEKIFSFPFNSPMVTVIGSRSSRARVVG